MMQQALKNRWLKALTSGKFRQATLQLKTDTRHQGHARYCCLGVLGKIADPKNFDNYSSDCYLPKNKACGLSMKEQQKLSAMNDDNKMKFKEIAEYIKDHIPAR